MIKVGLKLYQLGYGQSRDILLAIDYQIIRRTNPTKCRARDIRPTIIILIFIKYVKTTTQLMNILQVLSNDQVTD